MTRLFPSFACAMLAGLLFCAAAGLLPDRAEAATLEITGPDGASVVVNDRIMGFLPLSHPLTLPPGQYVVQSELPGYHPFETRLTLFDVTDRQRLQIRPTRMSKRVAWTGNLLFAGMGQHYMGKGLKGYVFNLAEAGGLLTALAGELQRSSYRKDYLLFKDRYENSISINDIETYRAKSAQAYSDMEDMESLRNTGLMIAGGAVALSILDVLINFPSVETGYGEVPVQTGSLTSDWDLQENQYISGLGAVHAAIRLGF